MSDYWHVKVYLRGNIMDDSSFKIRNRRPWFNGIRVHSKGDRWHFQLDDLYDEIPAEIQPHVMYIHAEIEDFDPENAGHSNESLQGTYQFQTAEAELEPCGSSEWKLRMRATHMADLRVLYRALRFNRGRGANIVKLQ